MDKEKQLVQQQFGNKVAAYAESAVHASGESLATLLEMVPTQPDWRALDIATAAGHTAHLFAPHVGTMIATDLTWTMLPTARARAAEKGLDNLFTAVSDAEQLPHPAHSFDLVTCRLAAHHFPQPAQFVREVARILKPNGYFALVDNTVPHLNSRKKRDQQASQAAQAYINAFEKLRDPSHGRCLSTPEWLHLLRENKLTAVAEHHSPMPLEFGEWTTRMNVSAENKTRLRAMLIQAPELVREWLTPTFSGDTIHFHLTRTILIARRA